MGNKYIIELEDKPFHNKDGDFLCRVKGFNSLVFDMTGISKLAHYHEPDLEQVREEAYQKGYETGYEDGYNEPGKNQEEVYQRGLADAWAAARKICTNWVLPDSVLSKIFGIDKTIDDIMKENTASECIEKIRQYEQKQDAEIKVGDEVTPRETEYDDMIVTRLWKDDYDSDCIDAIGFDGRIGSFLVSRVSKTGKHYEIAAVLEKMRGEQDG